MAEDKNTFEEDVESAEFITLEYEDGTSERCEVLGVFDVEEKQYVALAPEEDETSVYLYGYNEHEDGTFSLADIEDDEEFAAVSEMYESLMDEGDADDENEDSEEE